SHPSAPPQRARRHIGHGELVPPRHRQHALRCHLHTSGNVTLRQVYARRGPRVGHSGPRNWGLLGSSAVTSGQHKSGSDLRIYLLTRTGTRVAMRVRLPPRPPLCHDTTPVSGFTWGLGSRPGRGGNPWATRHRHRHRHRGLPSGATAAIDRHIGLAPAEARRFGLCTWIQQTKASADSSSAESKAHS
ncbi:MAG: hypothetical protein QOE15_1063, partial [Acidimicrobiaceae bacterium]|nr:hypothetical protein [Acidimicrobiaceae bacterium]